MNTTSMLVGPERRPLRSAAGRRPPEDRAVPDIALPDHPLPPTRAARPPRSCGVFFAASAHSRLIRRVVSALCVALAAVSIVAGAEFALPVLNGKFVSGNPGPPLVASAMRAPIFRSAHPR
jgi:hypothetical protein